MPTQGSKGNIHRVLHEFVLHHRDALIERCKGKAALRSIPPDQFDRLEFGIPVFIDQLIMTLRLEQMDSPQAAVAVSGAPEGSSHFGQIDIAAAGHGMEMSAHGYAVDQVVHDYGDLCQSITDLAVETGARIESTEFRTLNRCLDNGIAGAVKEFTRLREIEIEEAGGKEHYEMRLLNAQLERRVAYRTRQLEVANFELAAFSYSIAHDLRSPLSTITGFAGLLTHALPGDLDERLRHYLRRICGGAQQMSEMIDALLALSQVSQVPLKWDPVDLSAVVDSLMADRQAREPERALVLDVTPGLVVHGDASLLRMAMDNLVGNAWKFSASQAPARISFGCKSGENGETVYFIRDNGMGFDMADAGKLFGVFERLHSLPQYAGHGIGLANVKRVIDRHGGRIWAESVRGQGATFYFTLGHAHASP